MIIYNVTSSVDDSVHDDWMAWMMDNHVPKIMETGKFYKVKIVKVLGDEQHGGTTYSVQYFAESREKLEDYYANHAPALRAEMSTQFGHNVLQFRTELEIIQVFKAV